MHDFTRLVSVHEFPFCVGTSFNSYEGANPPAAHPVYPRYTSAFWLSQVSLLEIHWAGQCLMVLTLDTESADTSAKAYYVSKFALRIHCLVIRIVKRLAT